MKQQKLIEINAGVEPEFLNKIFRHNETDPSQERIETKSRLNIDYKQVELDIKTQIGENQRKRNMEKQNDLLMGQRMVQSAEKQQQDSMEFL
jgi:hypothetical protein